MSVKDEKKEVNPVKNNAKPYGKVLLTLKNQLLPEDKILNTPSQNDGLSVDAETDLRIYGCELIQTAGILLKLPQVAMATGQVLLQRFYYSKSLVRHPIEHTAMACVCLASKIEEAPRRVRDVVNVFTHIRQVNSGKGSPKIVLGVSKKHQNQKPKESALYRVLSLWVSILSASGSTFFGIFTLSPSWIEQILNKVCIRLLLSSSIIIVNVFFFAVKGIINPCYFRLLILLLRFTDWKSNSFMFGGSKRNKVSVLSRQPSRFYPKNRTLSNRMRPIQPVILDQNYIHLKNLVIKAERRVLKELGFCVHIKHPHKIIVMYLQVLGFQNNQKLMQYSWNYMNDSLRTDVFVRYQPETVACACIYLTSRKLKLPLPKNPHWYTIFGATEGEIRDICIRILKLYNRPKPNIEELEKQVDQLCEKYKDLRAKAKGVSGSNSPNNNNQDQKTSAHNAWGGFISRSGSHMPPPVTEKRSRSRSETRSPERRHTKKSKKYRSRSRSPKNHKKTHKRRSYSRSRSNSPHKNRKNSRSGNHMPPPVTEKRSRSRSESPERRHKKSKKHRSRSRSPKNHKKSHKRKSYSRSRSNSPHKNRRNRYYR